MVLALGGGLKVPPLHLNYIKKALVWMDKNKDNMGLIYSLAAVQKRWKNRSFFYHCLPPVTCLCTILYLFLGNCVLIER